MTQGRFFDRSSPKFWPHVAVAVLGIGVPILTALLLVLLP